MTDSPLTQASPTSLESLFNKDPFALSDDELKIIIGELRKERARWREKETKVKASPKKAAEAGLSIEDLEL